jgi:hypothetical protein
MLQIDTQNIGVVRVYFKAHMQADDSATTVDLVIAMEHTHTRVTSQVSMHGHLGQHQGKVPGPWGNTKGHPPPARRTHESTPPVLDYAYIYVMFSSSWSREFNERHYIWLFITSIYSLSPALKSISIWRSKHKDTSTVLWWQEREREREYQTRTLWSRLDHTFTYCNIYIPHASTTSFRKI